MKSNPTVSMSTALALNAFGHARCRAVVLATLLMLLGNFFAQAYDGSQLWLQQVPEASATVICSENSSPTIDICRSELQAQLMADTVELAIRPLPATKADGFAITPRSRSRFLIEAPTEKGLLYGTYALIRMRKGGKAEAIAESPFYDLRILNHWDNLDGTVERGFAGASIWKWDELPGSVSPRYAAYARANAAIGINGTVLNNVNTSYRILTHEYLLKVAKIADILRPYGIKVYLTANFASPIGFGDLTTADPANPEVAQWWNEKAKEIYSLIPDFGGFLVKANSEGQPGPCDYGRSHAEGANMLARALKPFGGVVMWRAFVYAPNDPDRAKQAYCEFTPLDGRFDDNVIIQIKNGPVDFQPREPYNPLFTGLNATNTMAEFQITQEYLGHSNHLAYLATMWEEFFSEVDPQKLTAVAGVANIGDNDNWTGHPFGQANWYAFGRLAWNPRLTAQEIAREWLPQSGILSAGAPDYATDSVCSMMLRSREAVVDYMMPMGLHHLFAGVHHYGPEPWFDVPGIRIDWTPKYYHKAATDGIGFNRTNSGTNAVAQYPQPLADTFNSVDSCPEKYLLWFHHLPWDYTMPDGSTLWQSLCSHYDRGIAEVQDFVEIWDKTADFTDAGVHALVARKLQTQLKDAEWWHDACLLYFAQYSGMEIPGGTKKPGRTLRQLQNVNLGCSMYENPSPDLLDSCR